MSMIALCRCSLKFEFLIFVAVSLCLDRDKIDVLIGINRAFA